MNLTILKKRRTATTFLSHSNSSTSLFKQDDFYYQEIVKLTGTGGWSIDFENKKTFFDNEARRILRLPESYTPSLKDGYKFYAKEHMERATQLFLDCSNGTPFETEIKMVNYNDEVFWAKAIGKPLRNRNKEIIGIRGVFRNINDEKNRELKLKQSIDVIEGCNKMLFNFADTVLHGIKSHVSNLQITNELFDQENLSASQKELFSNYRSIGESLHATIDYLNELVSLSTKIGRDLSAVNFSEIYQKVEDLIKELLIRNDVTVYTDFTEVEEIEYIPAYLENILYNLMTNAVMHKHPERDPIIDVFTYKEDDNIFLVVKDNGLGLMIDATGDELLKNYRTYQEKGDTNTQGLGLFLTKGQVEALGGSLAIESKKDKCTKIIIRLN